MKRILAAIGLFAIMVTTFAFVSTTRRIESLPMVFKKRVSIAPTTSAVPDTNALMQIGDADSSRLPSLLLYWTDTGKVTNHKKRGTIILNSADTTLWIYTGGRWKPV